MPLNFSGAFLSALTVNFVGIDIIIGICYNNRVELYFAVNVTALSLE